MKNRFVYILLLGVLLVGQAHWCLGQSPADLADEYYKKEEFEKAANEYAKLLKNQINWPTAFRYVNSLLRANKNEEADKYLKRQVRSENENKYLFEILTGFVASRGSDTLEVNKRFNAALKEAQKSVARAEQSAIAFSDINESKWAIKALLTARELSKDNSAYSEELAGLYRATSQNEKWLSELFTLNRFPEKREKVMAALQGVINTKDEEMLEKALYARVQQEPNELSYTDLLTWFFVQKQKFSRALLQEKATDRRLKLNGSRVYDLGNIALNNKEYKVAADAFDYVATTYPQGQLYPFARRLTINAREEQIKNTYPVDPSEIRKLINSYQSMLQEIGTNAKTLDALRSTANLYANYLDQKDTALTVLDLAIEMGKTDRNFVDKCKIDKGDIYLLKNEPWESTLLYSQVEKSQKEEQLGHEAKLKNAKLHYYSGNFILAKEILDILKLATSREIANDAEQLGLLIQDNTGMDSTGAAMRDYAAVELMLFQNKLEGAVESLNAMQTKYSSHMLADEILWLRANTYLKQGKTDKAMEDLKQITASHGQDILADDALFLQGKIYEERLKDKNEAMAIYQKLLTDHSGSIYVAEARKRFRSLRGDVVN
ncbi:tetratricopeptide repeat protein [Rudanella paleaurantiibacter]|uniref:Tetratricopeptide repeat protein n=1 Tax=Rudanella paleaurantiibacter TaxID=2614655 RepID=A0A7J5U431_9BACT|nr:tetratricopeptide repeat protein [Rudanella paleaurantiibacter]KAB7732272.1 tetratricopeptide repeat protein [Rudanella paleaurantiibacter]